MTRHSPSTVLAMRRPSVSLTSIPFEVWERTIVPYLRVPDVVHLSGVSRGLYALPWRELELGPHVILRRRRGATVPSADVVGGRVRSARSVWPAVKLEVGLFGVVVSKNPQALLSALAGVHSLDLSDSEGFRSAGPLVNIHTLDLSWCEWVM